MESSLSESVQQLVRPGKCIDLYYPDPETAGKQCFRTSQNTRYVQNFTNLTGGSNTFTIPPNNGVQDCIITLGLPASMAANMALPRGWGYALIKQISFRYGGSSQYFMTGQQVLQSVLSQSANGASRDALLQLGGNAIATGGSDPAQYAYCWLPLPHCTPTALGKLPPLPSDLLTQQIQIVVELYPLSQVISIGASGSTLPAALSVGQFQVQQVILENQHDSLARRVDMTSHALSYPVNFRQQEVSIQIPGYTLSSSPAQQTVTLTGFRSGEVKEVHCWLTSSGDTTGTPGATSFYTNPFAWYPLENVQMTYAGEVYARGDYNSTQLWNLVNGKIPSAVSDIVISAGNAPSITGTRSDAWTVLPFGQSYESNTAHSMYVSGKPITNGIVNIQFTPPAVTPSGTLTLHVSYVYNAVLTFSQGTVDYVF